MLGIRRNATAIVIALTVGIVSAASSQEAQNVDFSGKGRNLSFTLIEASPEFFKDKYEVLRTRHPELYVRRVITDLGDDFVLMVLLNDADIIEFLGEMIYIIDSFEGIRGSKTWLANVVHATTPITIKDAPRTGYMIAEFNGREQGKRATSIKKTVDALAGIEEIMLVGVGTRGADLIIIYDLKTTDIATHNTFMSQMNSLIDDGNFTFVRKGLCPPVFSTD